MDSMNIMPVSSKDIAHTSACAMSSHGRSFLQSSSSIGLMGVFSITGGAMSISTSMFRGRRTKFGPMSKDSFPHPIINFSGSFEPLGGKTYSVRVTLIFRFGSAGTEISCCGVPDPIKGLEDAAAVSSGGDWWTAGVGTGDRDFGPSGLDSESAGGGVG